MEHTLNMGESTAKSFPISSTNKVMAEIRVVNGVCYTGIVFRFVYFKKVSIWLRI